MFPKDAYDGFAVVAERYCQLVEDDRARSPDFLDNLRSAILELYTAAIPLPFLAYDSHWPRMDNTLSLKRRDPLYARLQLEIPFKYPRPVYNPLGGKAEPVEGSLAEDVIAIWAALRTGLDALRERPTELQSQVWCLWRWGFHHYWGTNAMDALRVFHELLRDT